MKRSAIPAVALVATSAQPIVSALLAHPAWASTYSGNKAASYADKWWGQKSGSSSAGYNSNFPAYGQDCTNFVSQAVDAGGLPEVVDVNNLQDPSAWFMIGHNWQNPPAGFGTHSNTWAVSDSTSDTLVGYLLNHSGISSFEGSYFGSNTAPSYPSGMTLGDVFGYNFDNNGAGGGENFISHVTMYAGNGSATGSPNGRGKGYKGSLVDAHTQNHHHQFWTLKAFNGNWQYTTIWAIHL